MIRFENISVAAGRFSLHDVSLDVRRGEVIALMGRTGSGKTTLLEALCGLVRPTAGRVFLRDVDVTDLAPRARGIGYVPQDLALFPTMTVREHLELALHVRGFDRDRRGARVTELAERLGITSLLGRLPRKLSGGERQRVALGRALSYDPDVLCLDEPLNALDEATQEEMYELFEDLRQETAWTVIHVTHSTREAGRLGDRIVELVDGRLRDDGA